MGGNRLRTPSNNFIDDFDVLPRPASATTGQEALADEAQVAECGSRSIQLQAAWPSKPARRVVAAIWNLGADLDADPAPWLVQHVLLDQVGPGLTTYSL